jgi:hypothetical protein
MARRRFRRQGAEGLFDKKMLGKQSIAGWEHSPDTPASRKTAIGLQSNFLINLLESIACHDVPKFRNPIRGSRSLP